MRPIRLKLAGLHSYREMQEIDFERLCEAGLFGIFGPTGSGKSTILDAITLALYGQVVRLGGGTHPKDVLNQLEQRVFVSFTFELGKGKERRRYTIEREFGVDKKGNRRQPEVRLIQCATAPEEADIVLESKAGAATSAIESLVGLNLQDFTRAVVLPQGQFSKFLTLKGSERNEMLQRMFGLHIYGEKLNERVRAALEQVKEEIHALQLELAALGDVSPEALQEARLTLQTAEQQEQCYSQQKRELAERMQELEQVYRWQQEREMVQNRLEQLMAQQAEMDALAVRIRELEASLQLWPLYRKLLQTEEEWTLAATALERHQAEQETARQEYEAAEKEYQQRQAEWRSEEPLLLEQKHRLSQAVEWERELAGLQAELAVAEQEWKSVRNELEQLTEQLRQGEEQLSAWERELEQLTEQILAVTVSPEWRTHVSEAREAKRNWERESAVHEGLEREHAIAEQEVKSLALEVERLTEAWQKIDRETEQAKQQLAERADMPLLSDAEVEQWRETLLRVKQLGREWREQLAIEKSWQAKWQQWEQEWQHRQNLLVEREARWQTDEERLREHQEVLEQAKAAWERWQQANMAQVLRRHLTEGEACPVCGSTEHPHLAQPVDGGSEQAGEELQLRMKEAEAAVAEAERQTRDSHAALQEAKLEIAAWNRQKDTLLEEQQVIQRRLEDIRQACHALGQLWQVADIDQLLVAYQQAEAELRRKLEEREAEKATRERLQQQWEQLREREAEQKRLYERATVLLEQRQAGLAQLRARLEVAAEQARLAEQELHRKRGELPVDEIESRYEALGQADRQLEQLQQARNQREMKRRSFLGEWEAANAKRNELALRETALRERCVEKKRLCEQKHRQWMERTGGESAEPQLAVVEATLSSLRDGLAEAEEKRKRASEIREQKQAELVKCSEAYAVLTRQRMEAAEALREALRESGIGSPEHLEQLYGEREQLHAYQERVNVFQTSVTQLRYDELRLAQALNGRAVSSEEWTEAKQAWEELEQALQTVKDQVAVARQSLARMESNHGRWQQLQERLAEQTDEQSRLEELKKLFEGKAFVQFIAEEKLCSIARDATYHLKRMTKNRYALEIGDEGEFVLRDEGAGGMRRPVSTLSGGETFLTSLALALALSMEIQMRGGRLEFFFLDEGFGTLDPELLEVVLDALERLRMSDFTIGVISHVPEIRVRMPRRLVVTPAEPLGRGSRVHMETE